MQTFESRHSHLRDGKTKRPFAWRHEDRYGNVSLARVLRPLMTLEFIKWEKKKIMTPHFVTRQQCVLLNSESGLAPLTGNRPRDVPLCTSLNLRYVSLFISLFYISSTILFVLFHTVRKLAFFFKLKASLKLRLAGTRDLFWHFKSYLSPSAFSHLSAIFPAGKG